MVLLDLINNLPENTELQKSHLFFMEKDDDIDTETLMFHVVYLNPWCRYKIYQVPIQNIFYMYLRTKVRYISTDRKEYDEKFICYLVLEKYCILNVIPHKKEWIFCKFLAMTVHTYIHIYLGSEHRCEK